jgi:hydrogenase expression/formation protein HypC
VLIHVGFAISRIDEAAALETLKILAELGELQESEDQQREGSGGAAR